MGGVLYFTKQPSQQIQQGSCGDGVCQDIEKEKGVCPTDCVIKKDEQADEDKEKPAQVSKEGDNKDVVDFQDSPFGIFAAFAANEFGYFNGKMGFTNEKYWEWAENHMKNLGAHWTRSNMQLLWDMVEPTIGGGYKWDNEMLTDSIIKHTYNTGNAVNWLGVFHEAGVREAPPKQKTGATRPAVRNPLDYPKEYGAFVKVAVERYDGDGVDDASPTVKVKYWQVGNEVFTFGDKSSFDLQKYVEFVRLIRSAAKEADTEAKIVLVAPTDGFSVSSFLKQVIEELAPQKEFDVIDVHHWGTAENWKMTAIPQYRQLLDASGLKDVEIWSTENGTWQGTPGSQPSQAEKDQAISLVKRYAYNIPHGLDKLFWNNLVEWSNFNGDSSSIYNSMGLIGDGQGAGESSSMLNGPRLSYYTYKKMTETLESSDWDNVQIIQEKDGVYIYKFTKNNKPIWMAWNDNSGSKQVTISGIASSSVKVTEAIPKYESGKNVKDYSTAFNTETKAVSGGGITITLKDAPVFVE